ncbi:MAG: hypothetical protein GX446_03435 [Chthonomonadales bacterium]|nr:hypothetical protein [Chthonomonadales bacterium]
MLISIPPPPPAVGTEMNVAQWAIPLPQGDGLRWTDPREIHRVVVRFRGDAPSGVRLQYWSSRWPQQRLPRDREPGGGDVGWWELGNWHTGEWRDADTDVAVSGAEATITFRPVNRKEHPALRGFGATWRFTHQIRVIAPDASPPIESIAAFTASVWARETVRIVWARKPSASPRLEAFSGYVVEAVSAPDGRSCTVQLMAASSSDPNSFDRTLVTVRWGKRRFTFDVRDVRSGPLYVPELGAAVTTAGDARTYAEIARFHEAAGSSTLYRRVAVMPEQTWNGAWSAMPPKKSDIVFPMGLDGGRQRFCLHPSGAVEYRINNGFIAVRPGRDTDALARDGDRVVVGFGMPERPSFRTIDEGCLPICVTQWARDGVLYEQTAFVTALDGTRADRSAPDGDATAVCMVRMTARNGGAEPVQARLPVIVEGATVALDLSGMLTVDGRLRGHLITDTLPNLSETGPVWTWDLRPGESRTLELKLPFVTALTEPEVQRLMRLDFDTERTAVAAFWRSRMDAGMRLTTPEPMLTDFHRAHLGHLLINCEKEPGAQRRFARVGSFRYAAFGNESCMMVTDLDRRGLHREAEECLEAWLHYQGTVGLPGDFSTREGVLYGAGGYEHGGYNQHHGWILWCLVEHYRFTRDDRWLSHALPGILKAADWIIGQRARTLSRTDVARGLLPAGSLEDIGDWWPWLSTNCYTWRGLDAAAWALERARHPEARRVRKDADAYLAAIRRAFTEASELAPVVRLRDGRAVRKFPSHPYLRGRAFGWICETLEGAIHLLITRVLDPRSDAARAIMEDYEDNLFLSNQYGYTVPDFERQWFSLGGMSMQSCLLLDAEPYLYRDDVKHALRAIFNAIAVGYFPDVRMITEHVLPDYGSWRGDHYKTSDEANAAGWVRYLFVREEGDELLIGQAIPREWLSPGKECGVERAATHFGPVSVHYKATADSVTTTIEGAKRNPPKRIRVRFRLPEGASAGKVTVNGAPARMDAGGWIELRGDIGMAVIEVRLR